MHKTEAALFDLDGVLIDSYEAWYALLNSAAITFGYEGVEREQYDLLYGQSVEADIETLFPGLEMTRLKEYFEEHFFDSLDTFHLMDSARESIQAARNAGLKTAIVTNTTKPLAVEIVEHVELEPDILIGSGDAERDKPEPDLLLTACDKLGVEPELSLMIGDSDFDSRAASAAGIRFIGYGRSGDYQVNNHRELQELLKEITGQ